MHLHVLILCFLLSQTITGTISSHNISESSNLLVRHKRVVNLEPGRDKPAEIGEFPYVVNIELRGTTHCVGSIISDLTVITVAFCATANVLDYTIAFGSISKNYGTARTVVEKKIHLGNHRWIRANDGIALFIVNAPLTGRFSGVIRLHSGPMLEGIRATVAGWGCYPFPGVRGTQHHKALRSITVPIMRHRECVNVYREIFDITDEDVCIYDEQKYCGNTDTGAPLIIDGQLAGVYLRKGVLPRSPEIFVVLQHDHYRSWITNNIVHRL